jgi:hypothetical protein
MWYNVSIVLQAMLKMLWNFSPAIIGSIIICTYIGRKLK